MANIVNIIHFYDDGTFREFAPIIKPLPTLGRITTPDVPLENKICARCGVPVNDAQLFDSCPHEDCPVKFMSKR